LYNLSSSQLTQSVRREKNGTKLRSVAIGPRTGDSSVLLKLRVKYLIPSYVVARRRVVVINKRCVHKQVAARF
jgi:hypothetical protein